MNEIFKRWTLFKILGTIGIIYFLIFGRNEDGVRLAAIILLFITDIYNKIEM